MAVKHDIVTGLGLQIFYVDITESDADLLSNLDTIDAYVHFDDSDDPDEVLASHTASPAGLTAEPTDKTVAAIWTIDEVVYGETITKTYFRFACNFENAGSYLIPIKMTDTNSNSTWSEQAISIGVGNGIVRGD